MLEKIENKLQELGIKPIIGGKYATCDGSDIKSVEKKVGGDFPLEYRSFLMKYGDSLFSNWVNIIPSKKLPKSASSTGKLDIAHFFSAKKDGKYPILKSIKLHEERMPSRIVPIGKAGDGLVCISVNKENKEYGIILFWDRNNEWDEEEYEDEHVKKMPREAKFSNFHQVAESFNDLIERMEIDPELS